MISDLFSYKLFLMMFVSAINSPKAMPKVL